MSGTFMGIPRNQIPGYPTINFEKCVGCGICADVCRYKVYQIKIGENATKKSHVKNPFSCKVYCSECQITCPVEAIILQSEEETEKLIKNLQQAKSKSAI